MQKNVVKMDCKVKSEPTVQSVFGLDEIYELIVLYKRDSGKIDEFKLQYSSGLGIGKLKEGDFLHIEGELRGTKIYDSETNRKYTRLYIHCSSIEHIEEPEHYHNSIDLLGYTLARDAIARKSKTDENIDITELTLRVPRGVTKVSYIPCTAWNNLARLSGELKQDDKIDIKGRLQSHTIPNGSILVEVSISYISK